MTTAKKVSPRNKKTSQIQQVEQERALQAVRGISNKDVETSLSELRLAVNDEIAKIQLRMDELVRQANAVQLAVEIKKEELKNLYSIEESAKGHMQLLDDIENTKSDWAREQHLRQQVWDHEISEYETKKNRDREETEYEFQREMLKKRDEFTALLNSEQKKFNEQMELKTKQMDERELQLSKAEDELTSLRQQVAGMQQTIDAKVAEETNKVTIALNNQHRFDLAKQKTEFETKLALADRDVQTAKAELAKLQQTLDHAYQTNADLRKSIENISTKAFESVSGQSALAAVMNSNRSEATSQPTRR